MRINITLAAAALSYLLCGAVPAAWAEYYSSPGSADSKSMAAPRPAVETNKIVTPSITISEEYTDNVFVTRDNQRGDFITRLLPGVAIKYGAPFWDWNIGYNLDYRYYARDSRNEDFTHNLAGKGNLRVLDNFLYLDVSDTYHRVSLDVNRDVTTESLFVNQSDQNILSLSPYIIFQPLANLSLKSGYQYTKATYSGSSAVDIEEHSAFLMTAHELTPKSTFFTNFAYTHDATSQDVAYSRFTPSAGIRYEYAEKSFVSLEGGYSWFRYDTGNSFNAPYWNAKVTHPFDFMTASLNAGVTYNSDPLRSSTEERRVAGRLDKPWQRGAIGLSASYSDVRNNETDTLGSRKYGIGGSGRYELTEKLIANLNLTAERFYYYDNAGRSTITGYPYRFFIGTGVSYAMANDLIATLDYNYTAYQFSIGSSANGTVVNRIIAGIRKAF